MFWIVDSVDTQAFIIGNIIIQNLSLKTYFLCIANCEWKHCSFSKPTIFVRLWNKSVRPKSSISKKEWILRRGGEGHYHCFFQIKINRNPWDPVGPLKTINHLSFIFIGNSYIGTPLHYLRLSRLILSLTFMFTNPTYNLIHFWDEAKNHQNNYAYVLTLYKCDSVTPEEPRKTLWKKNLFK